MCRLLLSQGFVYLPHRELGLQKTPAADKAVLSGVQDTEKGQTLKQRQAGNATTASDGGH